jgi:hypothetical protein
MAYLGSWALVAPITTFKFLLDFRLFLLEAITTSSLSSFEVGTWASFSYDGGMCTPFWTTNRKRNKSISREYSKILHDHYFSNIIFDLPFDLHWVHLRSCVGLGVGVWLFACLVIHLFQLNSKVFSTMLRTWLGLLHPLTLSLSHYICG